MDGNLEVVLLVGEGQQAHLNSVFTLAQNITSQDVVDLGHP